MVAFSKLQKRFSDLIPANNYGLVAVAAASVAFFIWNKGRLEEKEKRYLNRSWICCRVYNYALHYYR